MSHVTNGRRSTRMALASVVGLAVVAAGIPPALAAVPPSLPGALTAQQPNGSTLILRWDHSNGAVRYDVQVDDNAGFSSPEVNVTTVSNSVVPTLNLRAGMQYWRVQAHNSVGDASGYAEGSFTKGVVEVPVLVAPAEATVLAQPADPPLLQWNPSPGALNYLVEVDDNDDFVGSTTHETRSTSLVLPEPLSSGDWFWRVTATKENPANSSLPFKSQPSAARSFLISPIPAPVITAPTNDPDFELQDVVLDWEPVPGAVSYEVEVATNTDFSDGSRVERRTGIRSTRYSPAVTYDNNQYYWRVRGYDALDQPTPWSEARYDFSRTWPQRPTPVYPAAAGDEDVPGPLYFQWTAVPHASEYEIQVGTQENFSAGTFHSCRTAGTTYTPGMFAINTTGQPSTFRENEDCEPQVGEINYWRVRPLDRPFTKLSGGDVPGVQGLFSQTQAFRYLPSLITGMSPSGGAVVDVPTFTWTPVVGADSYEVVVRRANGTEVDRVTTAATSYTVKGQAVLPAGNYSWTIRSIAVRDSGSLLYTNFFTISGNLPTSASPALTPLTPISSTPGLTGAPNLTWSPKPGAAYYKVNIGNASDSAQVWFGSASSNLFASAVPYPAMTDISKRLQLSGTYDWQVEAYSASNILLETGPEGRFTVQPIQAVRGHAVAIGAQQFDDNYAGPKNPCTQSTGGCTVPTTPVLKWTPDPRVAWYMVYVAEDASFTNLLEPSNTIPATTNSLYAPALDNDDVTYGDNQAGKAYFWYIRPCRGVSNCGPDPVSTTDQAQGTFIKRSPKPTGAVSSDPAGGEITFTWDDYYATNNAYVWPQTGERGAQSAKQYRIEISVNGSIVEQTLVDQATYTSPTRLYPEGVLTWRVQAVDSDDNGLTWSDTETVDKRTARVTQTSPVASADVLGTVPLRWQAQAFASSYDVQVARDEDTTFSGGLVMDRTGVKTTAATPNLPISASDAYYVWRVRKTDPSGNKGPWSLPARFRVLPSAVAAVAPAPGATVPPNGPVVQWTPVAGATKYTVSLRPQSGPTVVATTVATAFSATGYLSLGSYTWTVTALDANDKTLGSVSSTFTVDSRITAVQPPSIESPGGTGVGKTLTSRPVEWNVSGVDTTYQWLREGQAIFGQTASTYTLTADDFGKAITLRATGRKSGYLDGTSTSAPLGTTSGDAVNNITRPTISGTPTVGSFLTGNSGTWSGGFSTSTSMVWLRDGVPIPAATSSLYRVTEADGDTQLTIRVTATQSGYSNGVMDSAPVLIQTLKAASPVTVTAPSGSGVGATLTLMPPVWNQQGVETTYMWQKDGQASWTSTAPTYTITADDVGKSISVRATGKKSGFPDGLSISSGITALRGSASSVTSPPSIRGEGKIGTTLQVDPGTWNGSNSFNYVWLRNGTPISGATNSTYTVVTGDAASQLTVRVMATAPGRADGQAETAPVAIAKIPSTTALAVKPLAVKPGTRGKLTITVSATGTPKPTGTLVIKDGKKKIGSIKLAASKNGMVMFKLPRLKAGKHKLTATYSGTSVVSASKGKLVLKVTR